MVVELTRYRTYITNYTPFSTRRYFVLKYGLPNFNDTDVYSTDQATNPVFAVAHTVVMFEGASVAYNGAALGAILNWEILFDQANAFFDRWVTTAAVDRKTWDLHHFSVPIDGLRNPAPVNAQWLKLYPDNYQATDDLYITLWGWVDTDPACTSPTPVDLSKLSLWRS